MTTPLKEILVTGVGTAAMKEFVYGMALVRQPLFDIAIGKGAAQTKIVPVRYRPV
jgi:hypothetical protein